MILIEDMEVKKTELFLYCSVELVSPSTLSMVKKKL